MKHFLKGAGLLTMVATMSACSGSTNPETATLFDNINNLNSGEYDRQIAANKSQAAAILANNRAAEQRIAGLESQRASGAKTISALKGEISSTRRSAAAARQKAAGNPAKLQRVSALEAQLASVEADINAGNADQASAKSELRRIRSALTAL